MSQADLWSSSHLYGPSKSRFPWTIENGGDENTPQESLRVLLEKNLLSECLLDPSASSTSMDITIINSLKLTLTSDGVLGAVDHLGPDRSCYKFQGSGQKELKLHMAADSPLIRHLNTMAQGAMIPHSMVGWRCQGVPWRALLPAIGQFKCPADATIAVSISFKFLKSERISEVRRPLSDLLRAPVGPEVSRLKDALLAVGVPPEKLGPLWSAILGAATASDQIRAELASLSSGTSEQSFSSRVKGTLPSPMKAKKGTE